MVIDAVTYGFEGEFVFAMLLLIVIVLLASLLHPQHMHCVIGGILYLAAIPSLHLYLIIYSICNLNDVSWGTREVIKEYVASDDVENGSEQQETSGTVMAADVSDIQEGKEEAIETTMQCGMHIPQCHTNNKLPDDEFLFWKKCISTYLKPEHCVNKSQTQMKEIKEQLGSMRLYILTSIIALNTMWVAGALTLHELHINFYIPKNIFSFHQYGIGEKSNYNEMDQNFYQMDVLIGLMSLVVTFILTTQMVGMICHRLSNISYAISKCTNYSNKNE